MSKLKKYRFSKRYNTAIITIPLLRKTITEENATDEDIDFLLAKFPGRFDHNFELASETEEVVEVVEPEVEAEEPKPYPSTKPSKKWTVEQLKAFAKDNDIKLGTAKKEATILKKILSHEA